MRNDLLFIDGELVDLDDDTKITLNIRSNIFSDLSKIVSNNSYTIKLPKTVRNQRIIQHADLPSCLNDYPRKKHVGRYFRNGVEIINKSEVYLLSINDFIEIALVWGNSTALALMVNEGNKLTDLPYLEGDRPYIGPDYREWKDWGKNDDKVYPKVNYGFKRKESGVWYHPVVFVDYLLELISSAYNITLVFSDEKKAQIQKMFIPLISRNDSEKYSNMCALTFEINGTQYDETVKRQALTFKDNQDSNYYGRGYALGTGNNKMNSYCSFISNGTPRLYGHVEVRAKAGNTPLAPTIIVYNSNQSGSGANIDTTTVHEISSKFVIPIEGTSDQYMVVFDFDDEKTSVLTNKFDNKKGKYIKFSLEDIGDSILSISGNIKVANIAERVILQTYVGSGWAGESYVDGMFWIIPNLPTIKQIDFIKAVSSILGVFAIVIDDNTIRFVSVDEIIQNKNKAVDWTKKVIASSYCNKPAAVSFSLEDFAQRNRYLWKEDGTVSGEYSGCLYVEDETIEIEREAMTLPFAATENYGGLPYIPLYSYTKNGDTEELQYKEVEPRLLALSGINGEFTSLHWEALLRDNYKTYQEVIRSPKIISEKIEISDIELKGLDVTIPRYLAQYGRYYAIISVKAEETGICECKLLQLEV